MKAELLFDLSLNLDRANTQDVGAAPQGHRRIVPESGGSFAGPKLKREVLPGGADWLQLRPDGVKQIDTSPEVAEWLARGETTFRSEHADESA
jgi:Protein of unknown function (DUF3237)